MNFFNSNSILFHKTIIFPAILLLALAGFPAAQEKAMDHHGGMGDATHSSGAVHVMNPWVRAAPPTAPTRAAYLTLRNTAAMDDALIAVQSSIAKHAEIHNVIKKDGMMEMRMVSSVALPSGQYVELKPGGYHVMMIELNHAPKVGEMVELTLRFRHAGEVRVKAMVREGPPMKMKH